MKQKRVFVSTHLPAEALERLGSTSELRVWRGELPIPRETLLANLVTADGLLSSLTERIDKSLMETAPNLRVVSNLAVGYDNIDVAEATRRGISVGNTPGVLTETTADLAFALMMAAARRVTEADRYVRTGNWRVAWDPLGMLGEDIHGATLGIIGLGRIGSAVARRAKGFNMKIIYYDVVRQTNLETEIGAQFVDLQTLLSESDFISIHSNLTSESRHLIDAKALSLMKKTCVLVNTARGSIIDSRALYEALRTGKVGAAALDVTDPEPIPPDHPLLTLENAIVTPHIGSGSRHTRSKMAHIAVDNLLAGLEGRKLPFPVNPEAQVIH